MTTNRFPLLTFALISFILSCTPPMPQECKEFFALPSDERVKIFAAYPLERQLVLYRCGMYRHPRAFYLSPTIADKGEEIIPDLLEKLHAEKDENFQYALIDIFEVMSIKGRLRNKPEVVEQIKAVVERMKSSSIKERALESLAEIEENNKERQK